MNCSQGPLIGTRDSFALSVLYDNFSALNSCDLQTELQCSIFPSTMSFFSETPRYEEQNLHSVFTSTKDYFYATVGKFGFFCLTKLFLILWPMANEKFCV